MGVLAIPDRDAHAHRDAPVPVERLQHVEGALDQRRLGEYAYRNAILGAGFQAAAGEAIARLERLVAICDAGEDDQLSLPRSSVERLAQQARRVRFDRDLPLEVGASTEPEILVRRPGVAISTGVEAPPVWVDAPAEADIGTVVVREDLARVVFVDLELRWRDLLQVLDLRREPRVGRIGDGSGN